MKFQKPEKGWEQIAGSWELKRIDFVRTANQRSAGLERNMGAHTSIPPRLSSSYSCQHLPPFISYILVSLNWSIPKLPSVSWQGCTYLWTGIYNCPHPPLQLRVRVQQQCMSNTWRWLWLLFSFCLYVSAFIDNPLQCSLIIYRWTCTLPRSHFWISSHHTRFLHQEGINNQR